MPTVSQAGFFTLQALTDLGALAVGGRIYTYTQGTTTKKIAYTDAAGSTPQTYTADGLGGEYIALNARGELPAPLYLTSGSYDITYKTSAGATVWTRRADPSGELSTFLQSGAGAVARTVQEKIRESPVSLSDYASAVPAATTPNAWYWDYTNADGAGQMQLKQTIPNTVNMAGGANVQGAGLIFSGDTSAATPNSGLAETNMIRMNYTVNAAAGTKMQVHMINGTLICAHDVASSGNEGGVVLGTMRATGPAAGGANVAMGIWGADFHSEKTAGVASGKMVGLEVGVHSAVSQSTATADTRQNGIEVWSGDRSGITAVAAHNAIDVFGDKGWTNIFRARHTDGATEIFKVTALGNVVVLSPTGSHSTTLGSNAAGTSATLTVGGKTGGSVAVNGVFQADTGGQITFGASTNHDVVLISNNVECARIGAAGMSVGGGTTGGTTFLATPAGTTAKSAIRIPHGSAPTSPVNGDMWTTTAGLFVRINGATIGPLT